MSVEEKVSNQVGECENEGRKGRGMSGTLLDMGFTSTVSKQQRNVDSREEGKKEVECERHKKFPFKWSE